ncbi:hypothetical protein [Mangrovibacterium sp.]|uniref:hypothetical protein n=1 Tax=Mangrovibacterium sp. TaxID=1961364 RepID=UPI0035635C35
MKKLSTDELLNQFLQFAREHFAENKSEILLGENAAESPEFVVTPVKPRKNDK